MLMNFVSSGDPRGLAAAAGFSPSTRATIILADPFSVPFNALLPALSAVRPPAGETGGIRAPRAPIVGGMASSAREPGGNTLLLDDQLLHEGGVGVTLSGRLGVDAIVSQGCRAVGPPMIVTGGKGQIISSLAGRSALKAITDVVESLDQHGTQLMQRGGLFLGRAVDEYKSRFGRDDFLIRPILSVDRASESVAIGDLLRVGQTVQLHVRDAETAREDLQMLLDKQRLHDPAAGALLFTCNGRGKRMFDAPDHDATAVARTFSLPNPGEQQARGGSTINTPPDTIPVAGFMAWGEIGPLGDGVFVHGQTAVAAFFRSTPHPADV
jgi:small ligand-binding sensory domain FIST